MCFFRSMIRNVPSGSSQPMSPVRMYPALTIGNVARVKCSFELGSTMMAIGTRVADHCKRGISSHLSDHNKKLYFNLRIGRKVAHQPTKAQPARGSAGHVTNPTAEHSYLRSDGRGAGHDKLDATADGGLKFMISSEIRKFNFWYMIIAQFLPSALATVSAQESN
ncbi:hypothetical protein PRIPAC_93443 [Pristionchus pacificus]|uniref:Uncharacterized protein n=1 Tax=Pristionchus pacificus TaxID=54126 RepID=A0A2A6CI33_PRIPA|nr:hypothetical protein PRIPAC_93443 [Pristionchus pacificus]|eukprot:PDM77766.1 hypothetical protein PRIPAC_34633 [Pristionchus pacificus]